MIRMQYTSSSSMQKKEFLRKWIKGLKICCSTNKNNKQSINVIERKKRIKLCADIAMVASKKTATCWSNALISKAYKQNKQDTNILVNKLLDPAYQSQLMKLQKATINSCHYKRIVLKRMKKKKKMMMMNCSAAVIAKRMVKKRRKVLRRLVPGGESMDDEFSLIKEALDYIISLKLQVDVMTSVVAATEHQVLTSSSN